MNIAQKITPNNLSFSGHYHINISNPLIEVEGCVDSSKISDSEIKKARDEIFNEVIDTFQKSHPDSNPYETPYSSDKAKEDVFAIRAIWTNGNQDSTFIQLLQKISETCNDKLKQVTEKLSESNLSDDEKEQLKEEDRSLSIKSGLAKNVLYNYTQRDNGIETAQNAATFVRDWLKNTFLLS